MINSEEMDILKSYVIENGTQNLVKQSDIENIEKIFGVEMKLEEMNLPGPCRGVFQQIRFVSV